MEQQTSLELTRFTEKINALRTALSQTIVGQSATVDLILTALLANGHVLLEGVPGVAKTLMAKAMARLLDASFGRIQFTPDLLPGDVLGTNVFDPKSQTFSFHAGPIFTQLLLVDEINRAPAKTQAALFEVMEERQVTMDGQTYSMDDLFLILATQNPIEQEGTYNLPEAQMDRFLLKIVVGYPTAEEELDILRRYNSGEELKDVSRLLPILSREDILEMRRLLKMVVVDDSLLHYIHGLVSATRSSSQVYLGASPRAAVALLQTAKAYALLQGRNFVLPDDVKAIAPAVLAHRLSLTADADMNGQTTDRLISTLLNTTEIPH